MTSVDRARRLARDAEPIVRGAGAVVVVVAEANCIIVVDGLQGEEVATSSILGLASPPIGASAAAAVVVVVVVVVTTVSACSQLLFCSVL